MLLFCILPLIAQQSQNGHLASTYALTCRPRRPHASHRPLKKPLGGGVQPESGHDWDEFSPWAASTVRQSGAALAAAQRASNLPGYARAWREHGIDPFSLRAEDWSRLPLMSKETLIESAK